MITVQLVGGLGNQMFQYAAGFALAQRCSVPLCLDIGSEKDRLAGFGLETLSVTYDALKTDPPPRERRGWKRRLLGKKPRPPKGAAPVYVEKNWYYDEKFPSLTPPLSLSGFFQSPLYFSGYEEPLRQKFRLKEPFSPHSVEMAAAITSQANSVAVHIRRGDYLIPFVTEILGVMSLDYYRRAVDLITALHGKDVTFYLFSDDPDWVEKNLDFCPQRVIMRGNEERGQEDMHLMALCDHHIIANSTFSWWGAWLALNPDKTVIGPRHWFTPHTQREKNVTDLYPAKWTLI